VETILRKRANMGLHTLRPYEDFKRRIFEHRDQLIQFIQRARSEKKRSWDTCFNEGQRDPAIRNITAKDAYIAEVNKDKFGCYTPGTLIPIISETEARAMKPDYFMVLPWHFKRQYRGKGS
jgi:hypothetical protein